MFSQTLESEVLAENNLEIGPIHRGNKRDYYERDIDGEFYTFKLLKSLISLIRSSCQGKSLL